MDRYRFTLNGWSPSYHKAASSHPQLSLIVSLIIRLKATHGGFTPTASGAVSVPVTLETALALLQVIPALLDVTQDEVTLRLSPREEHSV